MLSEIYPAGRRLIVGLKWLRHNRRKCLSGQSIFINNSLARVMGTALTVEVKMAAWDLVSPADQSRQVITKKRRL
jgi:hypothetical protein